MRLSVLVPRKFSPQEKEELERVLVNAGFRKEADGSFRDPFAPDPVSLRFEEDPVSDPFWVSCPLESLCFLPLEEIFICAGEEPSVRGRVCGLAKSLAKRARGIVYDHRRNEVYGPDGIPLGDYGTGRALGEEEESGGDLPDG